MDLEPLIQDASTKIVLVVMDGLGGYADRLHGTELEEAATPHLDALVEQGVCGLVEPVGPGITPGSGPGHLGLFGYDPERFELGRGALSAAGLDFELRPGDVAARGNLCTIDANGDITDRRAGRIPDSEAAAVVAILQDGVHLDGAEVFFRHEREHRVLVVLRGAGLDPRLTDTDPQQTGQPPLEPQPLDPEAKHTAELMIELTAQVRTLLAGQPRANAVLLRGFDTHRELPGFAERFGLQAAAVAIYPMYRGIARLLGMDVLGRPADLTEQLAIMRASWDTYDYFFLHHKYTDSAGEDGDRPRKIAAIEQLDAVVPQLLEMAPDVLVVSGDHSTPSQMAADSWHPVPALLWSERCGRDDVDTFGERACIRGGLGLRPTKDLMAIMLANAGRLQKYGSVTMPEAEKFDLHMSDSDALMWNIEKDPVLRSTIVTVNRLDRSPDWDRLVERIDLGSQLIPRLRQRVVTPIMRIGPPHWSADPDFDLTYHLRRLRAPEPATFDTVLELARTAAMAGFDRARPLWEFTLVEGLADGSAAMIMKVHHSVTDGVGGMKLAMMLYDTEREPGPAGPVDDSPALLVLAPLGLATRALDHRRRRVFGILGRSFGQARAAAGAIVRDPRGAVDNAALVGGSVARMLAPATNPRSPIMHGRSLSRDLGVFEVPLDDLKRAAKGVGRSLNDAFVAGALGGLHKYHEAHGAPCDDLRMTMPINVRGASEQLGGNHFTPARFLVPLTYSDPEQRMEAVGELSREARDEPAIHLTDALAGVLNQLPTTVATALFGAMLKGADFVTSNVPGIPFPVYLAGAELQSNYAFGPLSGSAANITLVSHCGMCCIGVNVDRIAVPDRDVFLQCLEDGFAEVVQLA